MFAILYVVFVKAFPLGKGVPHYPVYLFMGIVVWNFFDDLAADIDPAHGYDGSATGTWSNYTTNQAALQVGQPA